MCYCRWSLVFGVVGDWMVLEHESDDDGWFCTRRLFDHEHMADGWLRKADNMAG